MNENIETVKSAYAAFGRGDISRVLGHYHTHVKTTGREYDYDWAHVFTLAKGRITKFREYCETSAAVAAYQM